MSHCKEIKCGQNGNATDTDLRDIQFDGKKKKKKKFIWLTYQHPLGNPDVLNRTLRDKVLP